ncbi:MAG: hypothetical protein RSG55_08235 [Oscillospiraceae bacterium]
MTPMVLLDELKKFIEQETRDIILPVKTRPLDSGAIIERAAQVWPMRLPFRDDDIKKAPYILLQLLNGGDSQETGKPSASECNVRIIVCCYSENASEGAMNILNVITRIRMALLKKRIIGDRFTLRMPLEWLIYPDDTAPYFMGEIATIWDMPTIEREVLRNWQLENNH